MLDVILANQLVNSVLALFVDFLQHCHFGALSVPGVPPGQVLDDCAATGLLNGARHAVEQTVISIAVFALLILVVAARAAFARTIDLHGLRDVLESEGVFFIPHPLNYYR